MTAAHPTNWNGSGSLAGVAVVGYSFAQVKVMHTSVPNPESPSEPGLSTEEAAPRRPACRRGPTGAELDVLAVLGSIQRGSGDFSGAVGTAPAAGALASEAVPFESWPDTTQPLVNLKSVLYHLRTASPHRRDGGVGVPDADNIGGSLSDATLVDATILDMDGSESGEPDVAAGLAAALVPGTRMVYVVEPVRQEVEYDPFEAAKAAVVDACRKLAATGATPVGMVANRGPQVASDSEPDRWLEKAGEGLLAGGRFFGVPIVVRPRVPAESGPGMYVTLAGVVAEPSRLTSAGFRNQGDAILLLGVPFDSPDTASGLGGSAYGHVVQGSTVGHPPRVDLALASALHEAMRALICGGDVVSAHSCDRGGLLVAVAEACLGSHSGGDNSPAPGAGLDLTAARGRREDALLFGEIPNRIIVTTSALNAGRLIAQAKILGVGAQRLGHVGGTDLKVTTAQGVSVVPILELSPAGQNPPGPAAI